MTDARETVRDSRPSPADERRWLDLAARAGARGFGRTDPNPMVGCAIVTPGGRLAGLGHHRVFGGPHAEVEALASTRGRGFDPAGCTVYVTLEPCAHTGKTPPCADALIASRVGRVIYARRDPSPDARGGAARLLGAGVDARLSEASAAATALAEPFARRVGSGLPWVIVKWAQTIDGRVASRTGDSRWISGERSRRRVHRVRAAVDAVLTGVGTVLADDPLLTARNVPVRRTARRVVLDPSLRTPTGSALVRSCAAAPVQVFCDETRVDGDRSRALAAAGVEIAGVPVRDGVIGIDGVLRMLAERHAVATVLVEAGPTLVGRLLDADLADELHVYTAPLMLADASASPPALSERVSESIAGAARFRLLRVGRSGQDVFAVYRRGGVTAASPTPVAAERPSNPSRRGDEPSA